MSTALTITVPADKPTVRPNEALYGYVTRAFDFFNKKLWDGKLPPCLFTYHRNPRAFGYYHTGIFARVEGGKASGRADELALNPQYVATRKPEAVLATLVHEMCHHWQNHFGKEPPGPYHNKQWATEMKRIGLQPSTTGEPGGKEIGKQVSHYIIEGGPFTVACDEFLKLELPIFFQDRAALQRSGVTLGGLLGLGEDDDDGSDEGKAPKKPRSKGRAKFVCPKCKLNAWSKPAASLVCGVDGITMECEDAET